MSGFLRKVSASQYGITGLETAIILIAFVIVASVLAYVVLSAGLFSSQKAKEAVYAGLEESRTTIELKGNVLAAMENGVVKYVYFTVASNGGQSVDLTDTTQGNNKVIISYSDRYRQLPSVGWTTQKLNSSDNDTMLDKNELFLITVDLQAVSDGAAADQKLAAYKTFTLEVKPPVGAVLAIERTIPARVGQMVNLY